MAEDAGSEVKLGGRVRLPMWAVVLVGTVIVAGGVWWWVKSRQAAAAAATTTAATATTPSTTAGTLGAYTDPTTILPLYQGSTVTPQQLQALQQQVNSVAAPTPETTYTVTGTTVPSDQWPGGVARAAYQLSGRDQVDEAYYATLITLENPGVVAPYKPGTVLQVPVNPVNTAHTSAYPASSATA